MSFGIAPVYKENVDIQFNNSQDEKIATVNTNCADPIELPDAPNVDGKKFIGWGTVKDDPNSIVDFTTTTLSQKCVLYAIYEPSTDVLEVKSDEQLVRKMIDEEKQQIIIVQPDGHKYNVLGVEVK